MHHLSSIRRFLHTTLLLFPATCLLFLGQTAHAFGTLTSSDGDVRLEILEHHVRVQIDNGFARTEVDQVFLNTTDHEIEALYSFPLPHRASLSEVSAESGGATLTGEVLERRRAEQIYQQERHLGRDAAIRAENRLHSFEFRIAPTSSQPTVALRFVYYQPIEVDSGVGTYVYPLENTSERNSAPGPFTIAVELRSSHPVTAVELPGLEDRAIVSRTGKYHFRASYELREGEHLDRDFVFSYELADNPPARVDLITYRDDPGKSGTFMAVLTPEPALEMLTGGVEYEGAEIYAVTDNSSRFIDRGQQIVVFGRYDQPGPATLRLHGRQGGKNEIHEMTLELPEIDTGYPELERLWAMARIEEYERMARNRQISAEQARLQISDLGVTYQLVSSTTSMVVLTERAFEHYGTARRNPQRSQVDLRHKNERALTKGRDTRDDSRQPMSEGRTPATSDTTH